MGEPAAQLGVDEETHCPLCGADFEDHERLIRHESVMHPLSWS